MSSWRKTIPFLLFHSCQQQSKTKVLKFLLFHSCQQQSKTKVLKCALSRLAGLPRLRRSQIEASGQQILNPRCSQKLAANRHWKLKVKRVLPQNLHYYNSLYMASCYQLAVPPGVAFCRAPCLHVLERCHLAATFLDVGELEYIEQASSNCIESEIMVGNHNTTTYVQ